MTEDELDPLPRDMRYIHHADRDPRNNDPANLIVRPTAGEVAHPGVAYFDANGRPLIGPCDTPGCPYASLPGGWRHAGACDPRQEA